MTSLSIVERLRIFQYVEGVNILSDRELFDEIKLLDSRFSLTQLYLEYKRWHDEIKIAKNNGYDEEQLIKLMSFDGEIFIEHNDKGIYARCSDNEFLQSILDEPTYQAEDGWCMFNRYSISKATIYLYNSYRSIPYGRNIFRRLDVDDIRITYEHISNPNLEDNTFNAKYITLITTMDPRFNLVNIYKNIRELIDLSSTLDKDIRDWILSNESIISEIRYDESIHTIYFYILSTTNPIMKYTKQTLQSYKAMVATIHYGNRTNTPDNYISQLLI